MKKKHLKILQKTNTLNKIQRLAVTHSQGPIMIIAGPGSGKTRVITERIATLIHSSISPHNIMALTFTNKAAREMKERIDNLTKTHTSSDLWMGTFHSIFSKILRDEHEKIGYSRYFTIYDNDDSLKVIRRIIKDWNLDKETYNPKYIFSKISLMKNNMIWPEIYSNSKELIDSDKANNRPAFIKIYKQYIEKCRESNAMDFDDLLVKTYELFKQDINTLERYQNKFTYVLIDEYQDTNKIQDTIIKQIVSKHKNVCVVGDDSQSIYSFRGANINNMLNFKKTFPNLIEYRLEQNYRSTQNITNTANSLISNNKNKIEKTIWSNNEEGEKVDIIKFGSHIEEGEQIASIINQATRNNQEDRKKHAILYRTNSQSKVIEDGLRKYNIAYVIFGGVSFYQRKEIKDIIAYLRLSINQHDNEAILRVINFPARGIGQTSIDRIIEHAVLNKMSIWQLINSELITNTSINQGTIKRISEFSELIKQCIELSKQSVFSTLETLIDSTGIVRKLTDDPNDENLNRLENIGELVNTIKIFSEKKNQNSTGEFLNEVALLTDNKTKIEDTNFVSLMTIHQSKGLEFENVYISGLEEGLFPSIQTIYNKTKLEEERRLFYVAITRAIKKVTISYAEKRQRFGKWSEFQSSRFLDELNQHFITHKTLRSKPKFIKNKFSIKQNIPTFRHKKLSKISQNTQNIITNKKIIKEGESIMHEIFGKGTVIKEFIKDGDQRIQVKFTNSKEPKILITKFSKFKIISK